MKRDKSHKKRSTKETRLIKFFLYILLVSVFSLTIFVDSYKDFIIPTNVEIKITNITTKAVSNLLDKEFKKIENYLLNESPLLNITYWKEYIIKNIINVSALNKSLSNYTPKLNIPKLIYEAYCKNKTDLIKVRYKNYGEIHLYCKDIRNFTDFKQFLSYVVSRLSNVSEYGNVVKDALGLITDLANTVLTTYYEFYVNDVLKQLLNKEVIKEKLEKIKEIVKRNITLTLSTRIIEKVNEPSCVNGIIINATCLQQHPEFLINKEFYRYLNDFLYPVLILFSLLLGFIYFYLYRNLFGIVIALLVAGAINLGISYLITVKKVVIADYILSTLKLPKEFLEYVKDDILGQIETFGNSLAVSSTYIIVFSLLYIALRFVVKKYNLIDKRLLRFF